MTLYTGTFVGGRGATSLVGPGQIEVTPTGLVVTGTARRSGIAATIAGTVALVVTIVVVAASMLGLEAMQVRVDDLRLFVVIGLAAMAGTYLGVEAILQRVLPLAQRRHELPWSQVTSLRTNGTQLELWTAAPGLRGLSSFSTERAAALRAAYDAARAGR